MKPIDDATLAKLENEHNGKIRVFESPHAPGDDPEWQVVMRKPNGKESMTFRLTANNESRKVYAQIDIFHATCVWPEERELKALIDEFPFITEGVTNTDEWKRWVGLEAGERQAKSR